MSFSDCGRLRDSLLLCIETYLFSSLQPSHYSGINVNQMVKQLSIFYFCTVKKHERRFGWDNGFSHLKSKDDDDAATRCACHLFRLGLTCYLTVHCYAVRCFHLAFPHHYIPVHRRVHNHHCARAHLLNADKMTRF